MSIVTEDVVVIDGLQKIYRHARTGARFEALRGVSLRIRAGEIFALLGPNGAGKTTLIGCVAGLVKPTAGSARVLGRDVQRDYVHTRRAVGLVPQEINFDPFFTVEESVRYQAGYFGVRLTEPRLVEILGALGLLEKRGDNTRTLSGGMKRRLLIAKALAHGPRVLFLDEPTAGVDLQLRRELWAYVERLRAAGTTIVLTTHYLEEAEALADRIGLIDRGTLLALESKSGLLARFGERVLRVTLGAPPDPVTPWVTAEHRALFERLGAHLADDGVTLEVRQPAHEELGPVLAALIGAGLHVRDVETRRTRLEEVYETLLAGQPAGTANAPAGTGEAHV